MINKQIICVGGMMGSEPMPSRSKQLDPAFAFLAYMDCNVGYLISTVHKHQLHSSCKQKRQRQIPQHHSVA